MNVDYTETHSTMQQKRPTCKITTKSASWVAFAEPNIELVVSLCPSSSFRGCMTRIMWTFFSVANFRNLSKATSCTEKIDTMRTDYSQSGGRGAAKQAAA